MEKKTLKLEGLGCANCAAKMEAKIVSLQSVSFASVDFASQRLILETDTSNINELYKDIEKIILEIEPQVIVKHEGLQHSLPVGEVHSQDHDHGSSHFKQDVARLIVGGSVFMVALVLSLSPTLELVLFLTSYVIVGGSVVKRAVKNILRGHVFDEHFLMAVATIGAFLIGEYPEGVAVMLFYLVGELFQDQAVGKSRKSISALMDIRPDYANLLTEKGDSSRVSPESVNIGDRIVVKPGEKIPLDGIVKDGHSLVDTSALTGESMPRELAPGDDALSGFINQNGVLVIEVTKDFGHSTVSKILELVQHASSRKAPTEKFITKFARYYTPGVVFSALAIALIPPLVIQDAIFSQWVYRALVFLVISCPCALVISIPLGFFGGIGGASRRGILVKGSNFLEALNQVETVVFDKTGTLTKGVFQVTEIQPEPGIDKDQLVEYAAYGEVHSNHPIADSIKKTYGKELDMQRVSDYEEVAGHGIKVRMDGHWILVGNRRLMDREQIHYQAAAGLGTIVYVAVDHGYAGHLVIDDQIKEDAAEAIRKLKSLGIGKIVMLTGDLQQVGEAIGRQLGVDEVYAQLLPAEKVEKFEELDAQKSKGKKIIFVGDGINDAPVLARADIGMAMGGLGSDAAIEAADIVIMTDEPSKIVTALQVARRTRRIVYQNIAFAMGVKGLFLVLGAIGVASMWEAVFADVGVALIAILNAMRVMNTGHLTP